MGRRGYLGQLGYGRPWKDGLVGRRGRLMAVRSARSDWANQRWSRLAWLDTSAPKTRGERLSALAVGSLRVTRHIIA